MIHGVYSGYTHGCRCDDCRTAARTYHAARRAHRRSLRPPKDVYNLPAIDPVDLRWKDDAACKGMTDVFFPPAGTQTRSHIEQARAVCAGCPVQNECADYAAHINAQHGIWAGHTTKQLRAVS
jgi:WhiB family redox-sensing transcriptional regulator